MENKHVNKYLNIYNKMLHEYLKIFKNNQDFDKEKVQGLNRKLHKIYSKYNSQWRQNLLEISNDDIKTKAYLIDFYVNGFSRIKSVLNNYVEEIDNNNLTENEKAFLNFRHGTQQICDEIRNYLSRNLEIKISNIDNSKYNILGNYFGEFIIKKENIGQSKDDKFYPLGLDKEKNPINKQLNINESNTNNKDFIPSNKNLRSLIFKINKTNHQELANKYEFNDIDEHVIKTIFWPIIIDNSININIIKNELIFKKSEFIKTYNTFDIDIFKREQLDFLVHEVNEYVDSLEKGKSKLWSFQKGHYFHWFYLTGDSENAQTLLISKKDEIELEIYFKELLETINNFIISNKENLLQKRNTSKEKQSFIDEANELLPIASELIGLKQGINEPNSEPQTLYIDKVLEKYNLTTKEAIKILISLPDAFHPNWHKNIIPKIIQYLKKIEELNYPQQLNIISTELNNKIAIDTNVIDTLYDILKVHFKDQQAELKDLLENPNDSKVKLNFTDSCNKLADCFKKLKEANFISNCTKLELQNWIVQNFTFKNRGKQINFKPKTVEDIISNKGSKSPCKNPLIEISNGIVTKA